MRDLIERLRYKYADILHLEAADALERLTAELEACAISNKLKDFVTDTRGAEIERLTAEVAELHADAMEFDDKLTHVARLRLDLESENIRLRAAINAVLPHHAHIPQSVMSKLHAALQGESDE